MRGAAMHKRFLTARSPLRLLEKSLHAGGLGAGNLGLVLAGNGVGKTAVLVGIALDELLRDGFVLHVSIGEPVAHVRVFYDTVFEELAYTTQLDHPAQINADLDRKRRIRAYSPGVFTVAHLRDAVRVEIESGGHRPTLVVLEGLDLRHVAQDEFAALKKLATELGAEIWLSMACDGEFVAELPDALKKIEFLFSVILTLEPKKQIVELRALKDHDNLDLGSLRVALDPHTLLLIRN